MQRYSFKAVCLDLILMLVAIVMVVLTIIAMFDAMEYELTGECESCLLIRYEDR